MISERGTRGCRYFVRDRGGEWKDERKRRRHKSGGIQTCKCSSRMVRGVDCEEEERWSENRGGREQGRLGE